MSKFALKEAAIRLRRDHKSLLEIATELGIAKSTASLWLSGMPLPDDELATRRSRPGKRRPKPERMFKDVASTVKRGKAAELMFMADCLIAGLDCYVPVTEDGRVDVLIGGTFIKIQVKIVSETLRHILVCKLGCNSKTNTKRYNYTEKDVEFFVGVDLSSKDIYVIPKEIWTKYKTKISISILADLGFKNNLSLLMKAPGEDRTPS